MWKSHHEYIIISGFSMFFSTCIRLMVSTSQNLSVRSEAAFTITLIIYESQWGSSTHFWGSNVVEVWGGQQQWSYRLLKGSSLRWYWDVTLQSVWTKLLLSMTAFQSFWRHVPVGASASPAISCLINPSIPYITWWYVMCMCIYIYTTNLTWQWKIHHLVWWSSL